MEMFQSSMEMGSLFVTLGIVVSIIRVALEMVLAVLGIKCMLKYLKNS